MNLLKAFGKFWYEFIIGDDWKIAVAVVTALAGVYLVMASGLSDHVVAVLGAVLIIGLFSASLAVDTRRRRPK
jgi:hypothetical protein